MPDQNLIGHQKKTTLKFLINGKSFQLHLASESVNHNLGPIRTSTKFVYLDKIYVITNALQVRMVCRDLKWTKLQMHRRQNLSRVKIGQNRLNKQILFILSLIYVIKLLTVEI